MDIKITQSNSLNPRAGTTVDDLFLAEWNKEQKWSLAVGLQKLPSDTKVLSQARDGLPCLLKESDLLLTNEEAKELDQVITEGLTYLLSTGFCLPLSQHQQEKQSPQQQGPSLKIFGAFTGESGIPAHPFLPEEDSSLLYSLNPDLSFPGVKEARLEKPNLTYSSKEEYALFNHESETSKADLSLISLNSDLEPPPQRFKTVEFSLQPVNGQEEGRTEITTSRLKSLETLSGVTPTDISTDTPVLGQQDQVDKAFIKQELLDKREPQPVLVKTIEITLPTPHKSGTLKVELSPAHLGRVDISVTINEDGRINAVVQTEKSEAFYLLGKHQTELQKVITEAFGKELENFNLFMGMEQGTSQGQERKEAFDFYQLELQEISVPPVSQDPASDVLLSLRTVGRRPQQDLNHLDTWV